MGGALRDVTYGVHAHLLKIIGRFHHPGVLLASATHDHHLVGLLEACGALNIFNADDIYGFAQGVAELCPFNVKVFVYCQRQLIIKWLSYNDGVGSGFSAEKRHLRVATDAEERHQAEQQYETKFLHLLDSLLLKSCIRGLT